MGLFCICGEEANLPFCNNCGKPISETDKFCRSCGAAQKAHSTPVAPPEPAPTVAAPQQPAPAAPPANNGEQVIGVVLFRKSKSLGRYDTYTGVVTNNRLIFAQMTSQMLNDAAMQARNQAKAEGKGFFGQWGDQLKATFSYTQRYLTMTPEAILAETPENFAINNNTISEIKFKESYNNSKQDEFTVEVKSAQGKYEFKMDQNNEFESLLKRVYGDRVKMPFGHFSSHGFKVKLF
jgi:hypothetical protein